MKSVAPNADRVLGFDVARSLAILGMVVVHFSLVMGASRSEPGWMSVVLGFLDGRATAVFVILAGVGVTLMSRRVVASGDRHGTAQVQRRLILRGLFLLGLGFVNLRIWPGDILRVYGVSLLLAALLIGAPSRRLLLGAVMYEAAFIGLFLTLDFEKNWDWSTMTYHGLWTPAGVVRNLFYDGFRSVFPWTGLLYFGMWLGRLNLRDAAVNRRIGLTALSAAITAELVSRVCISYVRANPSVMTIETAKALLGTESMPALPLFLIASGGMAVAIIAASVRVVDRLPSSLWQPLVATGQMALTWYVVHIILGLGTIVALDLTTSQPLPIAAACGVVFFLIAVLASSIWKMFFRHGPLEWVMRRACD